MPSPRWAVRARNVGLVEVLLGIDAGVRRLLVPWVGESSILVWTTAVVLFTAMVTIPAQIVGWIVGRVAGHFLPERFD